MPSARIMFNLSDLILVSLLSLPVIYWYRSQPIRDLALKTAISRCEELNLQLLDNSVFQRRLWFKRDKRGQLSLWRSYHFEFTSTGNERYQGRVFTLGRYVLEVELDAHRLQ